MLFVKSELMSCLAEVMRVVTNLVSKRPKDIFIYFVYSLMYHEHGAGYNVHVRLGLSNHYNKKYKCYFLNNS